MLRLAAVRSTRRCVPAAVQLSRLLSTGPVASASTPGTASETPAVNAEGVAPPKTRGRKLKRAQQTKPTKVQAEPTDWKSLGLKYDPETLPVVQKLDPYTKEYDEEEYARTLIHGRSLHTPFHHPRTHDVPVASIHFRSHHIPIMRLFIHFASHAAYSLGIPVSKMVSLPTQRRLWTVLRSPFAHKKSQENFERRVHKRAIKAWDAHPDVVQRWVDYLRKHAMPGVGMRVTTWQRMPLGIGMSALQRDKVSAKDASVRPTGMATRQIEELAQKIIQEERSSSDSVPTSKTTA
ncbi:hypothetical protein D9619_008880 [Psilocybe cf. subviscida]|uniref:Small ribosomal subunit protein uS10m n=1 Tax=Psilocybe cf. subviscida TaxID=2480587 RepID=A0A8H5F0T8_9AGAR|nr:hypothetical protein D9619_008880 [Psilocybe cf. subviscida]